MKRLLFPIELTFKIGTIANNFVAHMRKSKHNLLDTTVESKLVDLQHQIQLTIKFVDCIYV